MYTCIIVDDESHVSDRLISLLEEYLEIIEIKEVCQNIEEADKAITEIEPDLVFLDIKLGEHTAFDLLKNIKPVDFDIIFTTAHNAYAVEAFEYSAVHYILKPIGAEELNLAMERFIKKQESLHTNARLETLMHNLEIHSSIDRKIAVPTVNGISFFKVGQIIRLEADGNYCTIHLNDGKEHLVTKRLKYYDQLLDSSYFFRVHQSHLVHLSYVDQFVKAKESYLIMSNEEKIPVATRKKEEFLKQLEQNRLL